VICLVILTAGTASADELHELQSGARIRATYFEQSEGKTRTRQITGEFADLTDCTLGVSRSPRESVYYLPRESITRLEKSIQPSKRGKAMETGIIVGTCILAASVIPVVAHKRQPGLDLSGLSVYFGGIAFLVCTTVGALYGLTQPGEKWQELDLSAVNLGFDAKPGQGGRLLLQIHF
jgi:hypothetical protein